MPVTNKRGEGEERERGEGEEGRGGEGKLLTPVCVAEAVPLCSPPEQTSSRNVCTFVTLYIWFNNLSMVNISKE